MHHFISDDYSESMPSYIFANIFIFSKYAMILVTD